MLPHHCSAPRWRRAPVVAVLSVLWCGWSVWNSVARHSELRADLASIDRQICLDRKRNEPALDCTNAWSSSYKQYPALDWEDVLVGALGPLLLSWVTAWVIFAAVRWVIAGFKPQT
jgi:hypothetical protein